MAILKYCGTGLVNRREAIFHLVAARVGNASRTGIGIGMRWARNVPSAVIILVSIENRAYQLFSHHVCVKLRENIKGGEARLAISYQK